MTIRSNPYVDHPHNIHTDYGQQFRSEEWKMTMKMNGIKLETSAVESHNVLVYVSGISSTFANYIRRFEQKIEPEVKKWLYVLQLLR